MKEKKQHKEKSKPYSTPKLNRIGNLEQITLWGGPYSSDQGTGTKAKRSLAPMS